MPVKKVLLVGSGGAGKSTLAPVLGRRFDLPVVHLDRLYWLPGWVETPRAQWRETVAGLVSEPAWVMDGNYAGTLDLRVPSADLIVFLDLPRRVTIRRVIWRCLRWRGRTRPDMAPGCPEQVSASFLSWLWRFPDEGRVRVTAAIDEFDAWERTVRLRSPREIRAWLASQPAA